MLDIPARGIRLVKDGCNGVSLVHHYQTVRINGSHLCNKGAEVLFAGGVLFCGHIQSFLFRLLHEVIIAGKAPVTVHTDHCDLLRAQILFKYVFCKVRSFHILAPHDTEAVFAHICIVGSGCGGAQLDDSVPVHDLRIGLTGT